MNLQQLSDTEKSQAELIFKLQYYFFLKAQMFKSIWNKKKLTPKNACSELSLTIKTPKCYYLHVNVQGLLATDYVLYMCTVFLRLIIRHY